MYGFYPVEVQAYACSVETPVPALACSWPMRVALATRCSTANSLCRPHRRTIRSAAATRGFRMPAPLSPNQPWRGRCWSARARLASPWHGSLATASYGDDRALRQYLEEHRQAYVLAVSGKASVWLQHQQRRISTLLRALPAEGWERLSAGMGSKGPRWYAWRRLEASAPAQGCWNRWCCSAVASWSRRR